MSPQRYRALLSYLPGMAVVVNSFNSPDVQQKVYDELMHALDVKLDSEGAGPDAKQAARRIVGQSPSSHDDSELAHDLVEGTSIHAEMPRV